MRRQVKYCFDRVSMLRRDPYNNEVKTYLAERVSVETRPLWKGEISFTPQPEGNLKIICRS
jgi:hypothetical protein